MRLLHSTFAFALALVAPLGCSSPSAPPESPASASKTEPGARAPQGDAAAAEPPKKACACQLKLRTPPASPSTGLTTGAASAQAPSPVKSELPSPPFDFERRSTCTAPICRLDGWLPDAAFADTTREGVPSQGAVWLETLADESTLVLPPSAELESLAVVLEGKVAYGEGDRAKAAGAPVLSSWSALRASGAGYSLAARGGKASVLVVVLSRSGTLAEAIARSKQKGAPTSGKATLEVADLAAAPKLDWGKGTNRARVAFAPSAIGQRGGPKEAAKGASLSLLQVSGRGELPETAHPGEWEHIAIVRGSGELLLGNARYPVTPGALFHVPPGALHAWKGGGEDLTALTIFSPGGPEQRYVDAAAKEAPSR